MQEKKFESRKQEYLYQLLDRLRTDCEYYLGNGNHHPQALWAGNEQGQIDKMREIWNQLEEKPEWLTWEDINDYAAKMGVEDLPSTKDGTAGKEIQDMLDRNYEREKKVGLDEEYNVSKKEYNKFCKDYDIDPTDYDDVLFTLDELEGQFGDKDGKIQRIREYVTNKVNDGLEVLDQTEKEQTLEKPFNDFVLVYQLQESKGYRFMSYKYAKDKINLDDYKLVAKVPLDKEYNDVNEALEYVFAYGNSNKNYYENNPKARSISVSDILQYRGNNYYVDSFGFVLIGKGDKLIEANIHTNQTNNIDLEKEKEEVEQQLKDVEELQAKKKELDDKVDELFEENKNIIKKQIESQVSNYTLEQVGSCLKDKGNDFKMQIQGSDTKTNWLNIDKDDLQKIYNTLSYKKKKTESVDVDLGLEPGSEEEAQYNELNDRNLKDEFNSLSEEEQQKYLDLVPENLGPVSAKLLNKIAEHDGLDKDILYWVVNIRGGKVEESEDKKITKFPSSNSTSIKLSNYDFEEAYNTLNKFKAIFTNEQLEWLKENDFSVNELYKGLKDLLATFKTSIFKEIISIDEYIEELNSDNILKESLSEKEMNTIINSNRTPNYFKGLKLKEEIIEAWQNKDLKTAYQKWSELFDLFSTGFDENGNVNDIYSENQAFKDNYELTLITDEIPNKCVYDVTDYGKTQSYKKYEETAEDNNEGYDSEFEYNGKLFKQFPNEEEAKRLDTLDYLYGLDTIYVKDLADEKNLTEKSFIEETANEYNVELISTIVVDGPNGEMYQVEVKGRPGDIARYFSLGEMKSLSDYFNNYSDTLAVSECDINESYEKLEESAEIFYGDTEVNLKLTDGTIIHIACDSNGEGYYYEVYDSFGDEIDGGLMEYEDGETDIDVKVEDVLKRLADFTSIPEIGDTNTERISDEDFIKLTTKSDSNFDMTKDYNYKLSDGRYLHFHTNEDGFDYSIFDENGKLIDGGILEYWTDDEDITEKEILNKLAEFTDIPELNDNLDIIDSDEFWDIVEY